MKKIHLVAGIIITVFIALHLFNHSLSILSVNTHIEFMHKLRLVYRNPVGELVLLLAVITQIITGIKIFLANRKTAKHFYSRLQNWTGLYLSFFLLVHISAVFTGRLVLDLDTNFYFGAAGLNTFPLNLFFVPYYGIAILSFFGHVSAIHYSKMKNPILGISVENQSKFILVLGVSFTILLLYVLTDKFQGVEIPIEYKIIP
ncbi:MAG: hypothetical protein ABJI69_03720 [Balneola sp.]